MSDVLFAHRYAYLSRPSFLSVARALTRRGVGCLLVALEYDDAGWDEWPGKRVGIPLAFATPPTLGATPCEWQRIGVGLDRLRPGLVLVSSDLGGWRIRALLAQAETRGIPIVVMPVVDFRPEPWSMKNWCSRSLVRRLPPILRALGGGGWVPGSATRRAWLAVPGENFKQRLIAEGVPADRITVTGNPGMDRLASQFAGRPVEHAEEIVFWTETIQEVWGEEYARAIALRVRDLMRGRPDLRLRVRVHPREPEPLARMYMEIFGPPLIDAGAVEEAFAAPAVHVAHFSAVLHEAALLGRPVISLRAEGDETRAFLPVGSPVAVWPGTEFEAAIIAAIEDPLQWSGKLAAWRKTESAPLDGAAGDRVAELITRQLR